LSTERNDSLSTFAPYVAREVEVLPLVLQHVTRLHREAVLYRDYLALLEIPADLKKVRRVLANPRWRRSGHPPQLSKKLFYRTFIFLL
jgi:hypothetical protein